MTRPDDYAEPTSFGGIHFPAATYANLRALISRFDSAPDPAALDVEAARLDGFLIGLEGVSLVSYAEAEGLRSMFANMKIDALDDLAAQ